MDLINQQGETVPVPDHEVAAAVASGQYGIPKGANVPVVNEAGTVGSLSADQAVEAFQSGKRLRIASPEEFRKAEVENQYGGVGGGALAAGAGALRGATAGLSDVAATQLAGAFGGEETKAKVAGALKGAQEANPGISTLSEVGGMLAPLAFSGGASAAAEGGEGASLLARVGRAVTAPSRLIGEVGEGIGTLAGRGIGEVAGESLAGRTLTKAAQLGAQGMVEGGLYGGGNAASEAALDNTPLTAEKLIAGVKSGAVLGGLGGVGLGATSVLAEATAKKVAEKLEPLLEHATTAEGIEEALRGGAERSAFKAAGAAKKDYVNVMGKLGEDGVQRVGRTVLEDLPAEAGKPFWKMNLEDISNAAESAKNKWGQRIGNMTGKLDEIAAVNPEVAFPSGQKIIDRVQKEVVDKLRANPFQGGIADQVSGFMDGFADRFADKGLGFQQLADIRRGLDDMIYRNAKAGSMYTEELRHVRGIIEDEFTQSGEKAANMVGTSFKNEWNAAKAKYADLSTIQDMSGRALAAEGANRFVSPSDYGMGFLGATLHGAVSPASLAMGVVSGSINHFLRKQGRQLLASGLDRAGTLFAAQRAVADVDGKIADAVDKFVSRAGPKTSEASPAAMKVLGGGQSKAESFAEKAGTLRNQVMTPQLMSDHVTERLGGIGNHAPQLAGTIAMKTTQAASYLDSKAPAVGRPGSLQPQFDKLMVSNAEALKWARRAAVVNNPLSVLDDLQHHRLTFEAVDTLRQTSPELYQDIRGKMMQKITETSKQLSYAQRIQLGLLFDFPADPSLEAGFIQRQQAQFQQPANQAPMPGGGKKGGGAPKVHSANLNLLKATATGSQKAMMR
jgi:hypothetical protein